MEKQTACTAIGEGQSTDESSESPGTFSPVMFEEDKPPDPSEHKHTEILEKVKNNVYFIILILVV